MKVHFQKDGRHKMNRKEYSILGGIFPKLNKTAQRAIIRQIMKDGDLDYCQTLVVLSFFIRKSALPRSEKARLSRCFPRCLKMKCVAYCKEYKIGIAREKTTFRYRYRPEWINDEEDREYYTACLYSRRGTLKYLFHALRCV